MKNTKTVGIIGAGLSGIITAKTCLEYGFKVKIFEKDEELGGVWASSRRYPGLRTQNTKDTYFFSDVPMPKHYHDWPKGEEMQAYLISYAKKFNVFPLIRFAHEITNTDFQNDVWTITGNNGAMPFTEQVDFLIICNGTFSDPYIPEIPGMDLFTSAGGKIFHSTQFHNTELSKDKRIAVVGYSKSASDIVTAVSETAATTYLVYREAKWKIPLYIKGIKSKYLLLNRLGESLIKPNDHNKMDKFVHKIGLPKMLLSMQKYISKKQNLKELGLVPSSGIKDQVFGEITLETQGFFEKVKKKEITLKQGEIASFDGKQLTLTNGEQIECDIVVFGTGFNQTIPFLPAHFMEKFTDEQGNYLLYRHMLPAGVPSLAFVGYNSSLFTSLTSEFAALWVCEYLKGRIARPSEEQILEEGKAYIKWRYSFRHKGISRGLNTSPKSIHHVDVLLKDMNASLPFYSLIPDWFILTNPARYKKVRAKIMRKNGELRQVTN